jgi:hypothetical protein
MKTFPPRKDTRLPATQPRSVRRALCASICGLLAVCGGSSHAATVLSQWNFNDAGNPNFAVANVGGYVGSFIGSTVTRSSNGLGVSGTSGDYALSLGGGGVSGAMMDATTGDFMTALNALTASQSLSITYWQNLNAISNSTSLWAQSSSVGRGLNAHSPWSDGNVYWDTAGCCGGGMRLAAPLGATIGEWELITLIYDNGSKSIYRGTTLIAGGSGFNPLVSDLTTFTVGNESPTHDLLPNARYDNFTVWSGALTPAEVAVLAVKPVPEPSAAILVGAGSLLAMRRRRQA